MTPNTETIASFFDAINRFDMPAITGFFAPDIVRIEPEAHDTAGTYRGIDDVAAHIQAGRGTWAEGSCDPEAFFETGDKVVVYLHAWVRLHNATEWSGGRFADGFVLRDGKIAEYHTFWARPDALAWAGIDAED